MERPVDALSQERLLRTASQIPRHKDWVLRMHDCAFSFEITFDDKKTINIWFYGDGRYHATGYWTATTYGGTEVHKLKARLMLLQAREEAKWKPS